VTAPNGSHFLGNNWKHETDNTCQGGILRPVQNTLLLSVSPPSTRHSSIDTDTSSDAEMKDSDSEYAPHDGPVGMLPETGSVSTKRKDHLDLDQLKLRSSKSPVIEAFVFCALQEWGVKVKKTDRKELQFEITDFDYFYERSNRICSKQRPTEDISARIKGLKRWFPDFPARRSQITGPFTVSVHNRDKVQKIRTILDKNRGLVGISKLRRSR